MSYKKVVTLYWNAHPDEKKEYDEAIRQFYIDSALDISGLGDIGKSIGDLSAYWIGKIKEDKALMELGGKELNGDLKALALLASPSKKFRKMMAIEKKLKKLKILLKLKYNDRILQKKFKHAIDFGLKGNYSNINKEKFKQILIKHSKDKNTIIYEGTYRGTEAVKHFYNPITGNNVIYKQNGEFISGWKLSKEQVKNLLSNGNIQ